MEAEVVESLSPSAFRRLAHHGREGAPDDLGLVPWRVVEGRPHLPFAPVVVGEDERGRERREALDDELEVAGVLTADVGPVGCILLAAELPEQAAVGRYQRCTPRGNDPASASARVVSATTLKFCATRSAVPRTLR